MGRPSPVAGWEREARRVLRAPVFDYFAGGAADEHTLRENPEAWKAISIIERPGVHPGQVRCDVEILGRRWAAPIALAPIAAQRLVHPHGELASARAAGRSGVPFCLSTRATADLADVAAVATGPRWFQIYVHRDRQVAGEILTRAGVAGFEHIVVTSDLARPGRRERELRHGRLDLPCGVAMATHLGRPGAERRKPSPGGWDESLCWSDLAWVAERAGRPVIVKGVLTASDARLAYDHGAQAVVVSNHGGRQLDGVIPTADALPDVAMALAGRIPVLVDGGIRNGSDVFRALALGARAVMVGRPYVWALAAGGAEAVGKLLEWLQTDLRRVMAIAGCKAVQEITPACLGPPLSTGVAGNGL